METKTTPRPERPTDDHMGRTDKDFAIEFGGYLANEAERFMRHHNEKTYATSAEADEGVDRWNALKSAIYEFRKRAERARA
jgi:hypothetical protein